ncbi:cysteine proteinase inhibitor 1-like [Primulina tabacum]|uniref:cysteine proteinase inhibitor 1-like n=1 Tax=Primulina tabacum TaxID=48773 RepID=UPI003F593ACD
MVASFHYQVSAVSRSTAVRFWQPIKDLNSPQVLEIARFAVSENNKMAGAKLQFVKVVTGAEGQYIGGTYNKLVIIAIDEAVGNAPGNYEAQVWDMPLEHISNSNLLCKFEG